MSRYTKLNQKGFSGVEGLLIIVIIAIIVFVGWFVYHSNQKASNTINEANQGNSQASVLNTSSTKTLSAAGTRAKEIATGLLGYSKANSTLPLKDYVNKHVNDYQFTSNFKSAVDNGTALAASSTVNPVYCSDAKAPSGFDVASSAMNGSTATVNLDDTVSGSSATTAGPKVTLVYANKTWSVDQYAC